MNYPTLYHYTKDPAGFQLFHSVQPNGTFEIKPYGIWATPDDEYNWEWWCRSEEFNLHNLKYRLRMQLKSDANVLWLKNVDQLDEFSRKYRKPWVEFHSYCAIDWIRVTTDYAGLLITPYLWERRLDLDSSWYYGWDCSSGCFWMPDVWESIEPDRGYRDINQKLLS